MRVTMLVRNTFTHDSRVEKEARSLTEAGHAVIVVAEASRTLPDAESRDGYHVVRVVRPLARVPLLRFIAYRRRLVRELVRTRPEVLHAHDSDTLEPVAAAARRLRIPFVYDAHELWLGQLRRGRSRIYWSLFLTYFRLVQRMLVPRAAAVITVSPAIASRLERAYDLAQVHVVPNYPEADGVAVPIDLRSLPGGDVIPAEAPIVLYVGAIMPGRGIEELLAAMREVPEAHLVLLGYGFLLEQIRALVREQGLAERVHFLGPVPPKQVVSYSASADVGVSPLFASAPSYALSLPNKLFQYMAAGLPVVASELPQVRDVVEGNAAGICVDTSQPSLIAAALRSILEDPQGAARMGSAGREAVLRTYNWKTAARELLATYAYLQPRARRA
jgi:glycosyltransferase involved in cell wall biosynthesis